MTRLENWSVYQRNDHPYEAPELGSPRLVGTAYGHPRKLDGKKIMTTPAVKIEGRVITTRSGTVYELGVVSPAYAAWCAANGIEIDEAQPVNWAE